MSKDMAVRSLRTIKILLLWLYATFNEYSTAIDSRLQDISFHNMMLEHEQVLDVAVSSSVITTAGC